MSMSMPDRSRTQMPAIAGGEPLFPGGLQVARPSTPPVESLTDDLREILGSGMLTNGKHVRELEGRCAEYLGVRHCVAVSSCTAGLMLVLKATDLTGDVIVPSFTFAATALAVSWNGLRPVFADIDPVSLTMSAESAQHVTGVRATAILATHTYGTPADVEALTEVAKANGLRLFFDAAHAFGSLRGGRNIGGFGDAEVFSLSPTKLLVAGEGGIIATNDDLLAERCRIGRDYGNPGDYDIRFVGLNARMSELHAIVALGSLKDIDERIEERNDLALRYRSELDAVPGIRWPQLAPGDRSTYKDFTILIDPDAFGLDATATAHALKAEGIETRRYYSPAVHRMQAYASLSGTHGDLTETERAANEALSLPMWNSMSAEVPTLVAEALMRLHRHSAAAGATDQPRVAGAITLVAEPAFEGSYQMAGFDFRLRCNVPETGAMMDGLLAPFRTSAGTGPVFTLQRTQLDPAAWAVLRDDHRLHEDVVKARAVDHLLRHVESDAIQGASAELVLHAAAVTTDQGALLLPAPPDSGKTTLAGGLVRAGFDYLTDEAAIVDLRTARLRGFPRALGMEIPAARAVPGLWEDLSDEARRIVSRYSRISPEDIRPGAIAEGSFKVRLVVFPSYRAGSPSTLERISRGSAFVLLAQQSFNLERFGPRGLMTLQQMLFEADCYLLQLGDLDEAIEQISGIIQGPVR